MIRYLCRRSLIGLLVISTAALFLTAPAASEIQINDQEGMTFLNGNLDMNGENISFVDTLKGAYRGTGTGVYNEIRMADRLNMRGNPLLRVQSVSFDDTIKIGRSSDASGERALALGKSTVSSGFESAAIGNSADAVGDDAVALGPGARAVKNSVALGGRSQAIDTATSNGESIAIGYQAIAYQRAGTALGYQATTNEPFSTAIGYKAEANDVNCMALGPNSKCENMFTVAVGDPDPTDSTYDFRVHNGDIIADGGNIRTVDGGSKNFVHQINRTHNAVYTSQESGEVRAIWEESDVLLKDGEDYVETPNHFRDVTLENKSMIVHVTPERPVAVGAEEKSNKGVMVKTSTDRDVRVDITVKGVREGFAEKKVLEER